MDKINELLEKFFNAETSLAEEQELKKYFQSKNVSSEHEIYRPMFDVFHQEAQVKGAFATYKVVENKKISKINWLKTFSYSGIAAVIALAVWIQYPQQSQNYAVITGTTIVDSEYAEKYAEKKLNRAAEMLKNGMKPMQNFDRVRNCLEPMQKINDTKLKIEDIKEKLQFK